MTLRLLFTGGGGAGNEALYRLWHDRYELHFGDAAADAFHPAIPEDRQHVIPLADAPHFAQSIAELCRRLNIDLFIPSVDEELPHTPAILQAAPGLKALLPPADFVAAMLDKYDSARRLAAAGLTVPRTELLSDPAHRDIGFPMIVKPRSGRGSRGVSTLRNADELAAYRALSSLRDDQLIAQALGVGVEYTVFVSADAEGNLGAILPVKVQTKRGITLRAEIELQPAVIAYCRALHEALRPSAVYNVQCILTEAGEVLPFEVNPRISTTFCLSLASGYDAVETYLHGAKTPLFQPVHLPRLARYWYNHIV